MAFTANVIFGLAVPVTQLLLLGWMTLVAVSYTHLTLPTT